MPRSRSLIAKLRRASPDEIRSRVHQGIAKRLDALRYGPGRSSPRIRMRPGMPGGQFFFSATDVPRIVREIRGRMPDHASELVARADRICQHRFDLLGYRDLDFGNPIDWHLDPVSGKRGPRVPWPRVPYLDYEAVGDHKVTWELSRHQHLVTLARAWCLTEDGRYVHELSEEWFEWVADNPYPIGINWASSLEVAFRAYSWLWIMRLLADCPVLPEPLRDRVPQWVGLHAWHIERYLSTYFSPNTHLLGEAAVLYAIGTLHPEFGHAERWRRTGWRIVLEEARRQVRPDGLHFEQSTYYHVYALDFFIHVHRLASLNGELIPPWLDRTLVAMGERLAILGHGGIVPRIGDDDGGRLFDGSRNRSEHLLDPLSTLAAMYERPDLRTGQVTPEALWLLGPDGIGDDGEVPPPAATRGIHLDSRLHEIGSGEPSGFLTLPAKEGSPLQLIFDTGPLGDGAAGHGHADQLSLTLCGQGIEILTDPGTGCYPDALPYRNRFRGTTAHNTLVVDDQDQTVAMSSFAWAHHPRSAKALETEASGHRLLVGIHDGYGRLRPAVIHTRWVLAWNDGSYLVRDEATGRGVQRLSVRWHVGPDLDARETADGTILCSLRAGEPLLALATAGGEWNRELETGVWSPAYGAVIPAPVVRLSQSGPLPTELATLLVTRPSPGSAVSVMGPYAHGKARAYTVVRSDVHSTVVYGDGSPWTIDGWASDARFFCMDRDASSEALLGALMARGRTLDVDGRTVIAEGPKPMDAAWGTEGAPEAGGTQVSARARPLDPRRPMAAD